MSGDLPPPRQGFFLLLDAVLLQVLNELANEFLSECIRAFFLRNIDVLVLNKIGPSFGMRLDSPDRQMHMRESFDLADVTTGYEFGVLGKLCDGFCMRNNKTARGSRLTPESAFVELHRAHTFELVAIGLINSTVPPRRCAKS